MSQQEPTEPYVYQPEPANSPFAPKLWGVSGPGTSEYEGQRFTREDAEAIVRMLKIRRAIDELTGENRGRRCERCGGQMYHSRLKGYTCFRC